MKEILKDNKICAILRNVPLEKTVDYAKAVYNGGVRMFEIAMNSNDAVEQIKMLRDEFKDTAYIGAGTVITQERCEAANKAGAQFFLTPSTTEGTLRYCKEHNIKLLPGVMTPTDVAICLEYGYSVMKLFPACDLPKGYVKDLKGPFDELELVAVGGVNIENVKEYLNQGFIGVGIGSNLIRKEYQEKNRWKEASDEIRSLIDSIN